MRRGATVPVQPTNTSAKRALPDGTDLGADMTQLPESAPERNADRSHRIVYMDPDRADHGHTLRCRG